MDSERGFGKCLEGRLNICVKILEIWGISDLGPRRCDLEEVFEGFLRGLERMLGGFGKKCLEDFGFGIWEGCWQDLG